MASIIGAVEFVSRSGHTRVVKVRPLVVAIRQAISYLGEVYRRQQVLKAHAESMKRGSNG